MIIFEVEFIDPENTKGTLYAESIAIEGSFVRLNLSITKQLILPSHRVLAIETKDGQSK